MSRRQRMKPLKFFLALFWFWIVFSLFVSGALAEVVYEDFSATITQDGNILLEWWTDTEVNNRAFYVQRSSAQNGVYNRLLLSYVLSESESGEGGYYYFFEDDTVLPDQTYFYRIEAIDTQGVSTFYGPVMVTVLEEKTSTPTQTGTIIPPTATSSPTAPRAGLTATFSAATSTLTLLQATQTAAVTGTLFPTVGLTASLEPELTRTPTPSRTFEPLPTIELIFPETATSEPQVLELSSAPQPTKSTATEAALKGLAVNELPDRLIISVVVVAALWICLGVFLVLMVRRLGD